MPGAIHDQELVLEEKRLRDDGTDAARTEQPSHDGNEMDEKNDKIAHHRIVAGAEVPRNYGRNNNSPATGGITQMDHIETANLAGVTFADLDWLLRGEASANVANRLGVTMADIEDFIRGSASATMTNRLGLSTISAAEELARAAGRDGAIGIVLGLLISV